MRDEFNHRRRRKEEKRKEKTEGKILNLVTENTEKKKMEEKKMEEKKMMKEFNHGKRRNEEKRKDGKEKIEFAPRSIGMTRKNIEKRCFASQIGKRHKS